ncbi:hypothetical protein QTO71_20925, partial [Klebsiella michiganensis]|nr:hypothetical protein [Klebsiella michiganensis]
SGKNSLNRLIRCVCGKKIGPDPRNFNQRVSLGRNDLLIRTFPISQICTSEIEYTLNISSCMKAATQGIPGSLLKYVTGVSEESQRTCSLKYDGYKRFILLFAPCWRILDNG